MTEKITIPRWHPTPPPAEHVVTTEAMAWMAGVIDLKGSVVRKNNKMRKTPQIVLYVQTKNAPVAVRLSELTGTSPEQHPAPKAENFLRRGCAVHCPEAHVHVPDEYPWQMPQMTRWSLTGVAAAVVLHNLAPYMSTYATYAGDVKEIFGSFAGAGQGYGAVRATLRRLAALGWVIPAEIRVRIAMETDRLAELAAAEKALGYR